MSGAARRFAMLAALPATGWPDYHFLRTENPATKHFRHEEATDGAQPMGKWVRLTRFAGA
jgi:hypothetical protein